MSVIGSPSVGFFNYILINLSGVWRKLIEVILWGVFESKLLHIFFEFVGGITHQHAVLRTNLKKSTYY